MTTLRLQGTTAKCAFACIAIASGVAWAGDEGDTLAGVAGFSVKVGPVDADGAEMGLTREGISAALEAGLRERELTVFSVQQLASKQGVGHPGVLEVRTSVEKMPVGFAGFIQMRVVQEALLRQGVYTVAATWHRDAQFTALSAPRGRELVAELIGELLDVLKASYRAANARPRSATGGAPLSCKRWAMHGVRPSDDWPVAVAILRDPPDPKWSTESKFTRMSSWTLTSRPPQASVGLSVFGVRTEQDPWTVALLSTSYPAPVSFADVVDAQRRVWGEPSRCGPEVKRFSIEAQGCFWQDNWCDTWAMVTELSGSKSIAVVLGTFEGWSQYQALLKQEDSGRKQGAR